MPIPPNDIKQHLNFAYIKAVAAYAGAKPDFDESPEYGIDGRITRIKQLPGGGFNPTGFTFFFQAKASTRCIIDEETIKYDLKVDSYNKLAAWEGTMPCILILMRLPTEFSDWLNLDEEQLILKHCCYWTHITSPPSTNRSSKRISIPRSDVFSPQTIEDILNRIRNGGFE